jgi:hypothetical protein
MGLEVLVRHGAHDLAQRCVRSESTESRDCGAPAGASAGEIAILARVPDRGRDPRLARARSAFDPSRRQGPALHNHDIRTSGWR